MTVISLVFKGSRPWADAGRQIAEADKAPESDAVGASPPRGTRGAVNALVIDASITVKWVVDEPGTPEALLLRRTAKLIAPDLLVAECANVLWKKVRRNELFWLLMILPPPRSPLFPYTTLFR